MVITWTWLLFLSVNRLIPHVWLRLTAHQLLFPKWSTWNSIGYNLLLIVHWRLLIKSGNGKYHVGYVITTHFDVVKAEYLPVVTLAQLTKSDALKKAWTLAKGKTAHIYTHSTYTFGIVHDFGILWNKAFLLPVEIKLKMPCMFRNYWIQYYTFCFSYC